MDDRYVDLRGAFYGHEWIGGYYCQCGHDLDSATGYLDHLAIVVSGVLDRIRADVWDEGERSGRDDALLDPAVPNPYRP